LNVLHSIAFSNGIPVSFTKGFDILGPSDLYQSSLD